MTWLKARVNDDPIKHVLRTQRWRKHQKEWKNMVLGSSRIKKPGRKPKEVING